MNKLVDGGVFNRTQLERINRVRHYKGVFTLALSEITHCDGITIRQEQEMLSSARLNYHEGIHRYPIQYPTSSDIELWKVALYTIFTSTNTLSKPLGNMFINLHFQFCGNTLPPLMCSSGFILHLPRQWIYLFLQVNDLGVMPVDTSSRRRLLYLQRLPTMLVLLVALPTKQWFILLHVSHLLLPVAPYRRCWIHMTTNQYGNGFRTMAMAIGFSTLFFVDP